MDTLLIGAAPLANINLLGICLTSNLKEFQRFVGIGASSILALLLSLNDDLDGILCFYRGLWKIGLGTDLVYDDKNLDSTFLKNWYPIQSYLESRIGNPTFSDLFLQTQNVLGIVSYNLNKTRFAYFSLETHPQMKVLDAIHLSISIPEYFYPTVFEKDVYIDPGYVNGIPLEFLSSILDLEKCCLFYLNRRIPNLGYSHIEKWARIMPVIENETRSSKLKTGKKIFVTSEIIVPQKVDDSMIGLLLGRSGAESLRNISLS